MVREYELGLVLSPDLSDDQLEAQVVRVGNYVESHGGEIVRLDRWGRRRLAYPIQRHRDGYYAFITMRVASELVREIENFIKVQEEILRYLVIFLDPRAQAERLRREQEAAARAATLAAQQAAANAPAPTPVAEAPAAEVESAIEPEAEPATPSTTTAPAGEPAPEA